MMWEVLVNYQKKNDKKEKADYPSAILDMYKNICHSLPEAELADKDLKNIAAALGAGYTVDEFREVFRIAEGNDFLKGNNDRKWKASFSWLIRPGNMKKVLSGKYDHKEGTAEELNEDEAVAAIAAAARESPADPETAFDGLPEACQKLVVSPLRLRAFAGLRETVIRDLIFRK